MIHSMKLTPILSSTEYIPRGKIHSLVYLSLSRSKDSDDNY